MAVVVLAFGLGLHLQFAIEGQTALIAAVVLWMALLVMHVAIRRVHAVAAAGPLPADIGGEAKPEPKQASAPPLPSRQFGPPVSERLPLRSGPPPLPGAARSAVPQQKAAESPRAPLQTGSRGGPEMQLPHPDAHTESSRPPAGMGWDLRPGAQAETASAGTRPAVFPTLSHNATAPAARKEAEPARFSRHEPSMDSAMPPRASDQHAPRAGSQHSNGAVGAADQRQAAAQADARAAELRSMQSIIDQLARQLKAPAEPTAASNADPAEPQAGTEQAIARSVEALKAAGGAMRAARAGTPAPAATRPEPTHPGGDARSDAGAAASRAAPSIQANAPVAEAVARESLEVCLDSILGLEDRKTRHFEMTVRMRLGAGEPVAIDDYALVQAGDGLRGRLDAAKLIRVARIAGPLSKRGLSAGLFVSLAADSLVDDGFLDTCANIITNQPDIVHQLVPSFSQGEIRAFTKPHWETLATLKENGLRFGLERLADLAMDFTILRERGFQFVKIHAGVLLAGMQAHDGIVSALQVCQRVSDAGLDLIVGGIDDDATLSQVGGLGVLYGQGTFFGLPRPVRVDLKSPHEAAA